MIGDDSSDGDEHTVKCLPLACSPQHPSRAEASSPATIGHRGNSTSFVPHHRKTRSLGPEYVNISIMCCVV